MGLLRIWETGYDEVCDTKEGEVRIWGRNEDRKKNKGFLFSYYRKGNIIQRDRKGDLGRAGKDGEIKEEVF